MGKLKPPGPRVLVLDIETAPLEVYSWGVNDQTIPIEFIIKDWSLLSFSAKWLDDPTVHFRHTGGRGVNKVRDDKALLKDLWGFLDEADVVIGQNVRAFDLPRINARMLIHGMKPYSPVRIVDTMLLAKAKHSFTSNKLAWLTKNLTEAKKSEHKKFPGFTLWKECLKDNKDAWEEMQDYNAKDVISTEELYLELRPWSEGTPNSGVYQAARVCTKCGSLRLENRGFVHSQSGKFKKLRCKDCGGYNRESTNLLTKEARKAVLKG